MANVCVHMPGLGLGAAGKGRCLGTLQLEVNQQLLSLTLNSVEFKCMEDGLI